MIEVTHSLHFEQRGTTMFDISLGDVRTVPARFVALWWDAHVIPEQHKPDLRAAVSQAFSDPGVYAITGHHDSQSGHGVLYIGKADVLSQRLPKSIQEHLSETHGNGQRLLYSDVWNLTIRWARLSQSLLISVEKLLIMSHSPPFNSHGVRRGQVESAEYDLIVMNAGRKGPILPIVAGAYQAPWQNKGGPIGP